MQSLFNVNKIQNQQIYSRKCECVGFNVQPDSVGQFGDGLSKQCKYT